MKYLEIKNNEDWQKVLSQVEADRAMVGNTARYIAETIESALMYELIADDAIYGGKTIMEICQEEGISLKHFMNLYLPKELFSIKLTDLGNIRLIATHGDCEMCGFEMEADGREVKCTNCDHSLPVNKYYEL